MTCSTRTLSHTSNKIPRKPIAFRSWSAPQRLLYQNKISNRQLADISGVSMAGVNRVLTLGNFHKVSYADVMKVRATAERLLLCAGENITDTFWHEYDERLQIIIYRAVS